MNLSVLITNTAASTKIIIAASEYHKKEDAEQY